MKRNTEPARKAYLALQKKESDAKKDSKSVAKHFSYFFPKQKKRVFETCLDFGSLNEPQMMTRTRNSEESQGDKVKFSGMSKIKMNIF